MKRKELIKSREYWITDIQLNLFEIIDSYLKDNNLNRTQLAEKLGVTKGYVSQVLNGDFDHKISKMVDLSLAVGKVPIVNFKDLNEFIGDELCGAKPYTSIELKVRYSHTPSSVPPVFHEYYEPTKPLAYEKI